MAGRDDPAERKPSIEIIKGVPFLVRTSPSQVKTFDVDAHPKSACQRKWWYDKRAQQARKPDGKGVKLGKECHGREERFLLTGDDIRGKIELAGAHLLEPFLPWAPYRYWTKAREWFENPNNETRRYASLHGTQEEMIVAKARELAPLKVEESIGDLKTPGGVTLIGFSDLMLGPGYLETDGKGGVQPAVTDLFMGHVADHKFKKNLAQYAETAADLESDSQSIFYSAAVLLRWPTTQRVRFAHHNHQTEGRKDAYSVPVIFTRDQVLAKFGVLSDKIDSEMQAAARCNTDLSVKANTDACGAFGGCDFALICPSSPRNRFLVQIPGVTRPGITLEVKEEEKIMGLVDQMQQALAASQATTPAAGAPAPTPGPVMTATTPNTPVVQAGGHSNADAFIPARTAGPEGLYFAQNQIGRFKGLMGDVAIFVTSAGAMYQTTGDTPVRFAGNDPAALAAFGMTPAVAPAPTPTPAPVRRMDGMPIVELINGVQTQVSGPVIPGLAQANLPAGFQVQGAGVAINPPNGQTAAPNPEVAAAMAAALQASQAAALGLQTPAGQAAVAAVVAAVNGTPPAAGTVNNPQTTTQTTTPAAGEEKPKARRGRPPGRKAAEGVANGTAQAEQLGGLILIVDGAVSGEHRDLSDYVADLHEVVCNAVNPPLADVRLADPKGPLGYGAWRGAMAAAASKSPPTGVCTISRGDLADPVIEALSAVATLVIRGRV